MNFFLRLAAAICFIIGFVLGLLHVASGDVSLLFLGLALWVTSSFFGPDTNVPR